MTYIGIYTSYVFLLMCVNHIIVLLVHFFFTRTHADYIVGKNNIIIIVLYSTIIILLKYFNFIEEFTMLNVMYYL